MTGFIEWVRDGCQGLLTWGLNQPPVPRRPCPRCGGAAMVDYEGRPAVNPAMANKWPCPRCKGQGLIWGKDTDAEDR